MTTITIPAIYENGVITPLQTMRKKPCKITLIVEYRDDEEEISLKDYLKSSEYHEEEKIYFDTAEDFLKDLNSENIKI